MDRTQQTEEIRVLSNGYTIQIPDGTALQVNFTDIKTEDFVNIA